MRSDGTTWPSQNHRVGRLPIVQIYNPRTMEEVLVEVQEIDAREI